MRGRLGRSRPHLKFQAERCVNSAREVVSRGAKAHKRPATDRHIEMEKGLSGLKSNHYASCYGLAGIQKIVNDTSWLPKT
jgi:hypothetical protein